MTWGTFDYFGKRSHPGFKEATKKPIANCMLLREASHEVFVLFAEEKWLHFTLANAPYPESNFTFPVHEASVTR